jgi:DNA-binding transcriptional ArsR family regulator
MTSVFIESGNGKELTIQTNAIRQAALLFKALNHDLRQQILHLLHKSKGLTVTEVYVKLQLDQPVASQHLAILRRAKLVTTRRDGKNIYYSVDYESFDHIKNCAFELLKQPKGTTGPATS